MRHLYSALLIVLLPFALVRLLWRARRQPALRARLGERFGLLPETTGESPLWLHAVSVGEVRAASPLIEALLEAFPQTPMVVSTTTPTGAALLQQLFENRVQHVYCPWDVPAAISLALTRLRPRALLLMETELWPNLIHQCGVQGRPVLLLNARLSARSARRYRWGAMLARPMLNDISHIACQGEQDAARFCSLGADASRVTVGGNLKYEQRPDHAALEALRTSLDVGERPVFVAGSTHPGEEEQVVSAFLRVRDERQDCLLILAPRHPERANELAASLLQRGLAVQQRSSGGAVHSDTAVLLLDGIGELALVYGLADVAFVGGSLVNLGGHNPLEPACLGVPVICGPSTFNFDGAVARLREAGALRVVSDADELAATVLTLFQEITLNTQMGQAGEALVAEQRGALAHCLSLVREVLVPL